ncbi:hypothetical protein MGH68_02670 [Erysipelothrix sp. D19-032]
MYTKFYKKDIAARKVCPCSRRALRRNLGYAFTESVYDNMIENAITTYELPMGVAPRISNQWKRCCDGYGHRRTISDCRR